MEEELEQDAVFHHFYSIYTANTLRRKLFKDLHTSQ